jgi:alkyl sulfatase BDS1-like metallo-beta-lactamase superfamily hydrolase
MRIGRRCRFGALALLCCASPLGACGGESERVAEPARPGAELGLRTRDLAGYGDDLDGAVRIHDRVWQARGTANAQLVTTSDGHVLIDTGLPTQRRLAAQIREAAPGPIRRIVLTHAHADHYGATSRFADADTEIIVHAQFPHNQRYLKALAPLLMQRNKIFFPDDMPPVPDAATGLLARMYPTVEPTTLVHDRYEFVQGDVRFQVLAMPGAEGADGLCVWLPDHGILFTGDFFGHIFPMWPNFVTIRGERPRYPLPYVESLNLLLELDPEMIVPSHFEPIVGRETIREGVIRTRDAVLYVHDAVVEGMNAGKDVHTLMREISLPPELQVPEVHGKVSWGVRSIFEAYLGWFHLRSATELYAVPPWAVYPDLVELAGGADPVVDRARSQLSAGRPLEALHLVEVALAAEPNHAGANLVRVEALELLLERSGGVNHYETYWLRHRIDTLRD